MDDFNGLNEETIFEKIEFKIFKADPHLYNELVPHIERVKEIWQPQDKDLAFIDDASVRIVPDQEECLGGVIRYVQVANYTIYDKILVDSNVVDHHFDEVHKAGLRWHEIFYSYTRTNFFTPDSSMARLLTGLSFSTWNEENLKDKFEFAMHIGLSDQTPVNSNPTNTTPQSDEELENTVLFISDDLENLYIKLHFYPSYLAQVGLESVSDQDKENLANEFVATAKEVLKVLAYLNDSKEALLNRFDRITNNPDEATHVLKLTDLSVSWDGVYQSTDVACRAHYTFTVTDKNNLVTDHIVQSTYVESNRSENNSDCENGNILFNQMPNEMTKALKNIRPVFTEDRQKTLYLNPELFSPDSINISYRDGVSAGDFSEITTETIIEKTRSELENYFPMTISPFWRISKGITTSRPTSFDYELKVSGPIKIEYGYGRILQENRKVVWRTIPIQILNETGHIIKEYEVKEWMYYSSFSNGIMQISSKARLSSFEWSLNNIWVEITGNICRFPLSDDQETFWDNMDQWIEPRSYSINAPERTLRSVLSTDTLLINSRRYHNMNIDLMREQCLETYRNLINSL